MRNYRTHCLVLCLLVLVVMPFSASAETSIAVVDVQKLLTESNAAQSIQNQLQKQRDDFLAELSKQEQELKKTEQDLVDQKATLSAEDFAKKKKEFEEKFLETRKMAQKKKRTLDEAVVKAMAQLEEGLYKVVQSIADENEYTLVISRHNVVIGEKSLDISDEAMKKLNESVSDITLDLPSK